MAYPVRDGRIDNQWAKNVLALLAVADAGWTWIRHRRGLYQ